VSMSVSMSGSMIFGPEVLLCCLLKKKLNLKKKSIFNHFLTNVKHEGRQHFLHFWSEK
jgi:hypothetical protein